MNQMLQDFQRAVEDAQGASPAAAQPSSPAVSPVQYKPAVRSALEQAFRSLSPQERETVQEKLLAEGLYQSSIDGLWGAGTRRALETFNSNQAAAEYDLGSAEDAEQMLLHVLSLGEPDVFRSTGVELPSAYLGAWVTSLDRCEYDSDFYLLNEEGVLHVGTYVWMGRDVEVLPDGDGYLLKGWGFSEGLRTTFEVRVNLLPDGRLKATGDIDTMDAPIFVKCPR
ncbi:peptidoglycan-binding protein [Thiohalocapsa marina]|uniref:Peptidoglycan-binding protein n=1 Tax=Thiohalocapsa marina TaxID=424902 RepID=A0A5M8FPW8_9GAMM|nr:peptidoglycan-binding protein [Thiohalocapsa marina]KAA6184475.1 peptidoglycan-binding protein [Thiohalocapsa marina]